MSSEVIQIDSSIVPATPQMESSFLEKVYEKIISFK